MAAEGTSDLDIGNLVVNQAGRPRAPISDFLGRIQLRIGE